MEAGGTHGLPFQSHIQRVVRKLRDLIIITLIEAYTFAALNVNGRYYFDGRTP
jgi:hypothetical protein